MIREQASGQRTFVTTRLRCDLAVVGGGMAGVCCAITAARAGIRVVLVQDRPVLGGNASSEIRLWVLGATCHMGSNNRWAREGGVIDEILVENLYRNPEGNPVIFDMVLLDKVAAEPNITLLLNTAVFEVAKTDPDMISSVTAFCSQNETLYEITAPLFCDSSGDGVVGFLAGAAFRMGVEAPEEFGEKFAAGADFESLLGHSLYFYSKDAGKPVRFIPPSFALDDITRIPRFRSFNTRDHGCRLWWIEWGGALDTIHDTERIKWELWRVVYGVWNHIKNSGQFPEAETLTLEWVGQIPGKRESRRFEGRHILRQQDIVNQTSHYDVVAHGGWSIDLHPAAGVYSERSGSRHGFSRGVYGIPYRCLYSRNIRNLFLAGRIISASHVAFGSTRVMATCAVGGQAVGMAAAICSRRELLPDDLARPDLVRDLQQDLLRTGQFIPGHALHDPDDLSSTAAITSTSALKLSGLNGDGPWLPLDVSRAQLLPLPAGPIPAISFEVRTDARTELLIELRTGRRGDDYTPDVLLDALTCPLDPGETLRPRLSFRASLPEPGYAFVCLAKNPAVSVRSSLAVITGVVGARHVHKQDPEEDLGIERFDLWAPSRRPEPQNLAFTVDPPLDLFSPSNVINGFDRPTSGPNAWVSAVGDLDPEIRFEWPDEQVIGRIELTFDTDSDHPMESVLMTQPERAMPCCVRHYKIVDSEGVTVFEETDNHQTRNTIRLSPPLVTRQIRIQVLASHGQAAASILAVRCYPA